MRALAAMSAMVLLLLVGPLAGPAPAAAPPSTPREGPLRLEIEELGPRVVTADGPPMLSVVGTVTNTGAEPVRGLAVRLQRGEPLATEGEVRDALRGAATADGVAGPFVELPGELAPGARMPVRLAVALRGTSESSLGLSRPGVYELLINVNGVPAGGGRARLAAARMLLPVLSLPPVGDTDRAAPVAATVPQPASVPVPVTLLYPIADVPRRLATVPGEPVLLTDDDLAGSFAPGGRLHGLVTALAERAPTGSRVRAGTCAAVDADLVATAAAMRAGYQVPAPDGSRVPGAGGEAAGRWLDLLSTTVHGGCLLALPFADADLVALTRGDLTELATGAVTDGRTVLAEILDTPVLDGTTWPVDGVLDERTLARTVAPQGRAVVLSADGIASGATTRVTGVVPVSGGERPQLAVLADPLLTRAATGPAGGGAVPEDAALPPAAVSTGTATPLSTQDTIGSLAFRARVLTAESAPLLLAPPHQWAAERTGAAALLTAVDQMIGAGLLTPRGLEQVVGAGIAATGAQRLVYPLRAGAREIPAAVLGAVTTTRASLADLHSAAAEQGGVGIGVDEVFAPLRQGLVRATSSGWRGRPDAAERAAAVHDGRIQELRAAVRVLKPPSPYALGTTDAPLLLTVANGLPISMRVRVELTSSGGLRVAPIPEQVIPPLGRRQVQVSAEVTRSGQFVVDAAVRSPDGGQLGPVSQLRVRSAAYGTITVWLTGTAGALLVVLTARRVLRRIRRETDAEPVPIPAVPIPTDACGSPLHDPPDPSDPSDRTVLLPALPMPDRERRPDDHPDRGVPPVRPARPDPPDDETAPLHPVHPPIRSAPGTAPTRHPTRPGPVPPQVPTRRP